ncbi:PP2C family protein-serine/threonine phosphatase [Novosphingobium aquimarinum]|uniref:PP2C family protein-serine/threonine phosphatase n=1 Tax=Novosphingobium aquimarinum TaxID=2682494 RepID=UPI0012EC1EC7|nr:protein phosphatase 2C domain-containing protein [Novosphingobium aquimarinum]
MQLKLDGSAVTHCGKVRSVNEDAICDCPQANVWAVADGMGGHAKGEWASSVIAASLAEGPVGDDFEAACHALADRIHAANRTIFAESQSRGEQMGSTVVALHVRDDRFAVIWVGDSRAYLLRDRQLYQLTVDHSRVQDMVEQGLLDPAEAENHAMRNMLSRAVGVMEEVQVDIVADWTVAGDVFLLCSDGLTCLLGNDEIARVLTERRTDGAVATLLDMVLERGAPDNVSIVAIDVGEATQLQAKQTDTNRMESGAPDAGTAP